MPIQQLRADAQLASDGANFILIEGRQRLDDAPGFD